MQIEEALGWIRSELAGSGYSVLDEETDDLTGYVVPFIAKRIRGIPDGAVAMNCFLLWKHRGVVWFDKKETLWRIGTRNDPPGFERLGDAVFGLSTSRTNRPRRRRAPYKREDRRESDR